MQKHQITICIGSACFSKGNARNVELLEKFLKTHQLTDEVEVKVSGGLCTSSCSDAPNVIVDGVAYHKVDTDQMTEILTKVLLGQEGQVES